MKRVKFKGVTLIILIITVIMLLPACAPSKKRAYKSARKNSYIDTSQLGRNKYFFSKKYQKKLYRYKKR
ncbi:MAG: hypothetical protein KDB91_06225 [Bacteroidales bacterium]|jgi:hypothetical protein|nr:hypothetical protein [Bacteroidales bacterium]MDD3736423.1 hypothetical protein [Bacteroidales bacterium]NLD63945.1 hypothetical protein [Bacteroidales bacterium]HNT92228.1 hypothetical protein [Bacteroidales bacterium]HOO67142.1 hypothetical protein [Bacteroidales bacterium]